MKSPDELSMRTLDLRGLKCPLPALRARKSLASLQPGERLAVVADDPMAAIDLPHLCASEDHALVSTTEAEAGARIFVIAAHSAGGGGKAEAEGTAKAKD